MRPRLTAAGQYYSAAILVVIFALGASGCADTASITEEAQLASLTVSPGDLNPAFSSSTTRYDLKVSSSDDSVTIRANPQDSATKMTMNGVATNADEARSFPLPQPPSITPITIVLAAPSGTQKTYLVFVERPVPPAPPSNNNSLSALSVTASTVPQTLVPGFVSSEVNYRVEVAHDITEVTVSATKSDSNAAMSGSVTAGAGVQAGTATLKLGGEGTETNLLITVAAPNGDRKDYRITVKRAVPSDNNNLSELTVVPGSLTTGFSPNDLDYDVISSAASLTVSATKSDPDAVMSGSVVAGKGVPKGSATISLGGPTTTTRITITVTAPNGISKPYAITVSRPFR